MASPRVVGQDRVELRRGPVPTGPATPDPSEPDSGAPLSTAAASTAPLRDLLHDYREVLERADRLPAVVWQHSRAPGTSTFARLWRPPRMTLGTSAVINFHVTRSVDALCRAYAGKAALGELDEAGLRDRTMLSTFRESLKPVRLRWLVVLVIASAVPVTRLVLYTLTHFQYLIQVVPGRATTIDDQTYETLNDLVLQVLSLPFNTAAASKAIVDDFAKVGPAGVVVLVTALLIAGCVTLRVAATAFRLKRQLFNLADQPDSAVGRTTSTWHVPRTTGLYVREADVHADAGVLAAKEKPFDLVLSALVVTLVAWFYVSYQVTDQSVSAVGAAENLAIVLPFVALRLGWLVHVYRERARPATVWQTPTAAVLPGTGQLVDSRSPGEVLFHSILAPLPWFRLSRQMWQLESEAALQRCIAMPEGSRRRLLNNAGSLVSAALVWWLPMVAVRVWRIRRIRPDGVRVRGLTTMLVAGLLAPVCLYVFDASPDGSPLEAVTLLGWFLGTAVGVGAAQLAQNDLVRALADPVPFDLVDDAATERRLTLNLPPGWPPPPPGWAPPKGWQPDPSWPPAPSGWRLWLPDGSGASPAVPAESAVPAGPAVPGQPAPS